MSRKKNPFASAEELDNLTAQYFIYIDGEYHLEEKEIKASKQGESTQQKVWDREPEPATIAGLAFYLGFSSRQVFEEYEEKGKFADQLKRARLRIEAAYEKKLHYQSPTGAIFALKSMGWSERTEGNAADGITNAVLKVEIFQSGPQLASSENEVLMN
jgi:hypothetical protein